MSGFVVTATRLYHRVDENTVKRYFRGDKITDPLSTEDRERFLDIGAIAAAGDEEAELAMDNPEVPGPDPSETPTLPPDQVTPLIAAANSGLPVGPQRPPKAATVDRWRDWAAKSGKTSEDEAAKLSKADLQKL